MFTNLKEIVGRLASYPWYEVALELLVIWICIYVALRFLRGTRGAGIIKGFAFLIIVLTLLIRVLSQMTGAFTQINTIYDKFIGLLAILLIVVFQAELRRAMVKLGETRFFRPSRQDVRPVVDAVTDAVECLGKNRFGALIAIQRRESLTVLAQSGTQLNADISSRLLQSVFWPNNPLHDLGAVVQGDQILAAGVQFPLIEEDAAPSDVGSRHRAGLGLSAENDCLVVIVSEETGGVSIADGGRLERAIPHDRFREELIERLRAPVHSESDLDEVEAVAETEVQETPASAASQASTAQTEVTSPSP